MAKCAITTFDNPYDPFDQFDSWYMYDVTHGYNTCAYLGRIALISDALSETENDEEIEQAIDDILSCDFTGMYKKVTQEPQSA